MIWEKQPLPSVTAKLKEQGIRQIVFDPCANKPVSGDYLATMRRNIEALAPSTGTTEEP